MKMQKLSWITLPLQIQKRKITWHYFWWQIEVQISYWELVQEGELKTNCTVTCGFFCRSATKESFIQCFFSVTVNYYHLLWMCHSITLNSKINRLHERCLRLIYNDKQSTFHELLEKDCSVSIHTRTLQFLVTEM